MSTLDTQGMVAGYKVNRALNEHEKQQRFNINVPASTRPHYDLSLIKLNSTFVECVDKWYAMRGWVAMGGLWSQCCFFLLLPCPAMWLRWTSSCQR